MSEGEERSEIIRMSENEKKSEIIKMSEGKEKSMIIEMSEDKEKNTIIEMSEGEEKSKIIKMSEKGEKSTTNKMSEDEEKSKVVRIVNLNVKTNEKSLREFIMTIARPVGQIEKVFIRRHLRNGVYYAYIVLQFSEDAAKISNLLNGYMYNQLKLEVELIGPHLKYKFYAKTEEANTQGAAENLFRKRTIEEFSFNYNGFNNQIYKKQKTQQHHNSLLQHRPYDYGNGKVRHNEIYKRQETQQHPNPRRRPYDY